MPGHDSMGKTGKRACRNRSRMVGHITLSTGENIMQLRISQAFEVVMRKQYAPPTWFAYNPHDDKYYHPEAQRDYEMFKAGVNSFSVIQHLGGFRPIHKQREDSTGNWVVVNEEDVPHYRDARKQAIRQLYAFEDLK
jgi:hypothetical protein